jgi:predicted anti-sigma-YlaC factor YlaD
MNAADHNAQFEEVMAWLDGELPADAAARVEAHVAQCPACQRLEADMRSVSGQMAQWKIPGAPATLAKKGTRPRLAWSRWMPIAATLVIGVGGGVLWVGSQRHDAPPPDLPAAESVALSSPVRLPQRAADLPGVAGQVAATPEAQESPLLVRTAQLALVVRDLDEGRAAMERIIRDVGGFTGNIRVSGTGDPRGLTATLRIPTARLDETLAALKKLGQVTSESLNGEDVTQQSVDLDARLVNARASEARLKDILANRTGRLSDVLDVERELSRVRGEIEQMEAERKSLDRRITYAMLTLEMVQERKAAVDLGPLSVSTRLRNALVDGWTRAVTSALDAVVFMVSIAPVLLLWTIVLVPPAWLLKRRLAPRG